jgi:drug/metabolite transporter (DMT)-like permease
LAVRVRLAIVLYVVLWASGFVPSRVLVQDITPLWGAVLRLTLAGAALTIWALLRGQRLPSSREWKSVVAIGFVTNVVYLGLLYIALQHMTSGMAAIIACTNPLMLALVAPSLLHERLRPSQVTGLVIGFAGVVAIMSLRTSASVERLPNELIALVSVGGLVASTILFKRASFTAALPMVTGLQLLVGALILVPLAFALEGNPRFDLHGPSLAALAYLVLVMSIGASLLWFWLLERGEATRLSAYYYLTPILGLALSWLVLREPLHVSDAAGAVAVAVGIALVQRAAPDGG